jgi:hypothetical protein
MENDLRQKCLSVLHREIQVIAAGPDDPIEQSVIAFGAMFMAHQLELISDGEYDEFEALINSLTPNLVLRAKRP